MKLVHAPNNRTTFSAGWGKFAKDDALKEGDVCVYVLIKRVDVVLKVSVFRCSSVELPFHFFSLDVLPSNCMNQED